MISDRIRPRDCKGRAEIVENQRELRDPPKLAIARRRSVSDVTISQTPRRRRRRQGHTAFSIISSHPARSKSHEAALWRIRPEPRHCKRSTIHGEFRELHRFGRRCSRNCAIPIKEECMVACYRITLDARSVTGSEFCANNLAEAEERLQRWRRYSPSGIRRLQKKRVDREGNVT